MSKYIVTPGGGFYSCDTSTNELYHYGVPGMKWGHRKIRALDRKERRLNRRLVKDERRYQKTLKKYNRAQAKGASASKVQKLQLKEQAARAQRNYTQAKLDTARAGKQAAIKMMDQYANSPKSVGQLSKAAISKGGEKVNKLLGASNKKVSEMSKKIKTSK